MREQVPAFSPSAERRKTSIGFSRKEFEIRGAAFQLSRKWGLCKSAEACRDRRAEKKGNGSQSSSVEDMKEGGEMEGEMAMAAGGVEGADRGRDIAENAGSPAREGMVVLQWGHSKRPRCSRTDINSHHVPKNGSVADESSHVLLSRRAKASPATQSPARAKINGNNNSRRIACVKDEVDEEDGRDGEDDDDNGDDEEEDGGRKRARGSVMEAGRTQRAVPAHNKSHRRGGGEEESKTPSPSPPAQTQAQVLQQSFRLELPKVIICLSRKEKEDDFFHIRGTKLPHRPKRRPKAVEKLLHYCSPGSWLAELSHGRYDVREKKCVKKKPRGLKAMESSESDSE